MSETLSRITGYRQAIVQAVIAEGQDHYYSAHRDRRISDKYPTEVMNKRQRGEFLAADNLLRDTVWEVTDGLGLPSMGCDMTFYNDTWDIPDRRFIKYDFRLGETPGDELEELLHPVNRFLNFTYHASHRFLTKFTPQRTECYTPVALDVTKLPEGQLWHRMRPETAIAMIEGGNAKEWAYVRLVAEPANAESIRNLVMVAASDPTLLIPTISQEPITLA